MALLHSAYRAAFKELKSDLGIHPIHHQLDERIEAHIFVAFIAYCLQVSLKYRLRWQKWWAGGYDVHNVSYMIVAPQPLFGRPMAV